MQWNISDPNMWYFADGDTHPSALAQKEFFKACIKPEIEGAHKDKE